jgi:hypothetical protein
VLIGAASPVAGTDSAGNAYAAGFTGQITAFQPGSAPSVVESWHPVFLDGGWTNVRTIVFRLTAEGTVKVFGSVTHGTAFTAATNINATHPIDSHYWPTNAWNVGAPGIPGRAGVEITTAGVFVAEPNGTSCTECDIAGEYPLGF